MDVGAWASVLAALKWAARWGSQTVPHVARLPSSCRESAVHALVTCVGGNAPQYFPQGWGPCSHCWGWLCLGVLLGAAAVLVLWARFFWKSAPTPAWATAASELLACIAAGGESELADLAAAAGQSPTELLSRVLHEAAAPHAPNLPALPPPRTPKLPARRNRREAHKP